MMVCALILTLATTATAQYAGGTGTADDPYQIATAADLIALGETPDDYDKHFILTTDLDLSGHTFHRVVISPYRPPISRGGPPQGPHFGGVFDGGGHVIRDLHVEGRGPLGLFGYVASSAIVRDLGLENVSVQHTAGTVGALIGQNYGTVLNCYSTGTVTGSGSGYGSAGGLMGYNAGRIADCYSTATITESGRGSIGGLVGDNAGSVANCYSIGAVTAHYHVGGLIGNNHGGVSNCYSTGVVIGEDKVGGAVGLNDGTLAWCYSTGGVTGCTSIGGLVGRNHQGSVSSCYSLSAAQGDDMVGGLVGENWSDITNCYSTGDTTGEVDVGGLVGRSRGSVLNCYSTGAVTGTDRVGGLVGEGPGRVVGSFWNTKTSGWVTSSGGVGLTTTEMQDIHTYLAAGWDFVDETANGPAEMWRISQTGHYPRLSIFDGYEPVLPEGLGTLAQPYLIRNVQELVSMGYRPLASYRLDTDIDLSGLIWGSAAIPWFAGQFDGSGYTIQHLHIEGGAFLGLFGSLGVHAVVTDLDLQEVFVQGTESHIGSLAGQSEGRLVDCYSTGVVIGDKDVGGLVGENHGGALYNCQGAVAATGSGYGRVGGLIGFNYFGRLSECYTTGTITQSGNGPGGGLVGENHYGRISDCYSTGPVTGLGSGYGSVGGLAGSNGGSVTRCYSTGAVSASDRGRAGGLVGINYAGRVDSSFWDVESSGVTHSPVGAGLTTVEMMDPEWISLQGWASEPNWVLDPHRDYPRLAWEGTSGLVVPEPIIDWMVGQGTSEMPYFISDPGQLLKICRAGLFWDKQFVLTRDLDLAETRWSRAVIPDFDGTFDGDGHVIKNLRVSGNSQLGFVGCLQEGGAILNLGLSDANVAGEAHWIGGLVGCNRGSVSNCYSTGAVGGGYQVGGLVGHNSDGAVSNCYSTGTATGDHHVGGLIGDNPYGSALDCYSTTVVIARSYFGGLVGFSDTDSVANCFWDVETSGQVESAGGTGLTTDQMWTSATFLGAGWDLVGEVENGDEEIWWIDEGRDYPRLWWESAGAETSP